MARPLSRLLVQVFAVSLIWAACGDMTAPPDGAPPSAATARRSQALAECGGGHSVTFSVIDSSMACPGVTPPFGTELVQADAVSHGGRYVAGGCRLQAGGVTSQRHWRYDRDLGTFAVRNPNSNGMNDDILGGSFDLAAVANDGTAAFVGLNNFNGPRVIVMSSGNTSYTTLNHASTGLPATLAGTILRSEVGDIDPTGNAIAATVTLSGAGTRAYLATRTGTAAHVFTDGALGSNIAATATGLSNDRTRLVYNEALRDFPFTPQGAFLYLTGTQGANVTPLPAPSGSPVAHVLDISAGGQWAVGFGGASSATGTFTARVAALWDLTVAGAPTVSTLGDINPNGLAGFAETWATAVSQDGQTVLAVGTLTPGGSQVPLIWTPATGATTLEAFFLAGGADLQGLTLSRAMDMSDDGTVISGWAVSGFVRRGYFAVVTEGGGGPDTSAPTLDILPGFSTQLTAGADCQAATPDNTPFVEASDDCSSPDAIELIFDPDTGAPLGLGTTPGSVTALDEAGNPTTYEFDFQVVDTSNPALTCPADIAVDNDAGACGAMVSYVPPSAADNCGASVTCVPPSGLFGTGTTAVVCTATDPSSNTAQCQFTVTVEDAEAPVVSGCNTAPTTLEASVIDCAIQAVIPVSGSHATDNCGPVNRTDDPLTGTSVGLGPLSLATTFTDSAGLGATCHETLEVVAPPGIIVGTDGPDDLRGTQGPDHILGLGGNDILNGRGGDDVICGGDGDDSIVGGDGADVLDGRAGNDVLKGGDQDDDLSGGDGDDDVGGGAGDDRLDGQDGADDLAGNAGHDIIAGGAGDDTINGNLGDDTLSGASGNDTISGGDGADVLSGDEGNDNLSGGAGIDHLEGGDGDDVIEGNRDDDTVDGGPGDDEVRGGGGSDFLSGGDGLDQVFGGADNDVLCGGLGPDSLDGGAGADTCLQDGDLGDTSRRCEDLPLVPGGACPAP